MSAATTSTITSSGQLMDVDRISDTDEDVLTIDMSASSNPQESAPSVGLPATPSPSPSSMEQPSNLMDHRFQLEHHPGGTNGINYALPLTSLPSTANSLANGSFPDAGIINSSEELLDQQTRQNSESLSQSSSGEGKKWKSRQPKLCVHCDRYFSNQFNLKQHILNMV